MTHPYPRSDEQLYGAKAWAARVLAEDPDYFKRIGAKGGSKPRDKRGFQLMTKDQVRAAGAKGGRNRRVKADV